MILNKSNQTFIKGLVGFGLSAILIWTLYWQIEKHWDFDKPYWHVQIRAWYWLIIPISLAVFAVLIDCLKWQNLVGWAKQISFKSALISYFMGVSLSTITPNRLGEYPGRLMGLHTKMTPKLLQASLVGILTQLGATLMIGTIGILLLIVQFGGRISWVLLGLNVILILLLIGLLRHSDRLIRYLLRWSFFKRIAQVGRILNNKNFRLNKALIKPIVFSLVKFSVTNMQLMAWLWFFNINMPLFLGLALCIAFYWILTVVPSIAFSDIGIRGHVGLTLFEPYSYAPLPIFTAIAIMWTINILVPALIGMLFILIKSWSTNHPTTNE